jgi:predicted dehydrogenase
MKPNKTVRWGILGTARIASKIAHAITATEGAEVVAVASRSSERAAVWAAQHGISDSYGTYQALLDDDRIDVVYIPLPPSLHAEWTIRTAESGKHVLCEKPIALNVSQAEEMAVACRENNVQLMDATMWVHHPRASDMLRVIQDGTLGDLRRITSAFSFLIESYLQQKPPHTACGSENGELTLDKIIAHEFRFQRHLGGGALLDTGWYCVRVALWAFGCLPSQVFATARYRNDVDINLSALMWYEDERIATFDCGYDLAARKWLEVVGTKKSLVCDDFLNPWNPERPRYWLHGDMGLSEECFSLPLIQEHCMIGKFCEIVRSDQLDSVWPNSSIANQRICDAIGESARQGKVVAIE